MLFWVVPEANTNVRCRTVHLRFSQIDAQRLAQELQRIYLEDKRHFMRTL